MAAVGMLLTVMAIGSRTFSAEEFGLWAVLYALMNFAMLGDFGFRYALGNRLAALKATSVQDQRRITFLSILHLQMLIGGLTALACFFGLQSVPWHEVFHITEPALAHQAGWLVPLVCALLLLNQPLSIASTALFADHQIGFVSIMGVVQSLILVSTFWIAATCCPFFIAIPAFFITYLATNAAVMIVMFLRMRWIWGMPPIPDQVKIIRSLGKPALDFFTLSLAATISATVGPFLAGMVGGIQSAGDFSLIQRLFNLLIAVHMAALGPLAPAFTLHAAQGDWDWVRAKFHVCIRLIWPVLFVGGGALIFLAHPLLLRAWSGRWSTDYPLAGLLALGTILAGWGNSCSILLNSLGAIRQQALLGVILILPVIAAPLLLGRAFGIHGVALGALLCGIPGAFFTWRWAGATLEARNLRA
jgi:O-antigen/teichoic acid export membrane protein